MGLGKKCSANGEIADRIAFKPHCKISRKHRRKTKQVLAPVKVPALLCKKLGTSGYSKNGETQEEEFVSLFRKQIGESNVNVTNFIEFCRKTLFLETKGIYWEVNVWYVEKLNIAPERYEECEKVADSFEDFMEKVMSGRIQI